MKKILYLVGISSIFHDVGHIAKYVGHEFESVKILKKFMEESKLAFKKEYLDICEKNILVTNLDYQKKQKGFNKSQKVMMDADMYTLASPDFYYDQLNLKLEWKINKNAPEHKKAFLYDEKLWNEEQVKFFEWHDWHTEYAKEAFKSMKEQNLHYLRNNKLSS